MKNIIIGTAGHVDHGKTCLIKALTGTDCDRLKEEKKRGITIENGFADMMTDDYNISIIDVPGHEKFIRNMLVQCIRLRRKERELLDQLQRVFHLMLLRKMDLCT